MKTIKKTIVVLLGFVISACTSQQVIINTTSTPEFVETPILATISSTSTLPPIIYPNKFSIIGDRGIKFDNWHVSFSLPKDRDINKHELGFQANPYVELYFFYGAEYSTPSGGIDNPELSFIFQPLPDDIDVNKYLNNIENWTFDNLFKIEKHYSPKEMGINLETAIGYKCVFTSGQNKQCYVLRLAYEAEFIQVRMVASANTTQPVEMQFLEIIKSISLEN